MAGQKESAKSYIIKTTDRLIQLTTNCQETLPPALSQPLNFDNEVEVYLASKDDKSEPKQE
jgi:SpoVK/Ycf46/Vps4 family AAA+-type ATPase